jgi:hypothetical protein
VTERPTWNHKISIDDFRWLNAVSIVKITHEWEMISEDQARHWIELHANENTTFDKARAYDSFAEVAPYFEFRADHRSLLSLTFVGERARKDLRAIDEWERINKRDRMEYERLKRKFGDA